MFKPILIIAALFNISLSVLLPRLSIAQANEAQKDKKFSIGFAGGLPHMLALELGYVGLPRVAFSVAFGSFPADSIINQIVPLNPVSIGSFGGSTYSIVPSASYKLYGSTLSAKLHPLQGGWFLQADYAHWTFSGNVSANLRNETTSVVTSGVATASALLTLSSVGLSTGYQWAFDFGLYFSFAVGISTWVTTNASLSAGGTITSLASLLGQETFDISTALSQVNTQANSTIASFRSSVPVYPNLFVGIGWAF